MRNQLCLNLDSDPIIPERVPLIVPLIHADSELPEADPNGTSQWSLSTPLSFNFYILFVIRIYYLLLPGVKNVVIVIIARVFSSLEWQATRGKRRNAASAPSIKLLFLTGYARAHGMT